MKIIIMLLAVIVSSRAFGQVRVAYNLFVSSGYAGGNSAGEVRVRSALNYYKACGYTHFTYGIDPPSAGQFHINAGTNKYEYIGGNGAGSIANSLHEISTFGNSIGLKIIPVILSLSHLEDWIAFDNSISEFTLPPTRDHVARITASAGNLGRNTRYDELFALYLGLIRDNVVGASTYSPDYIYIGHDELGFNATCYIKADRSAAQPSPYASITASELVAMEINERVHQVDSVMTNNTQSGGRPSLLISGDSFLPRDWGQVYNLAGDTITGVGGTLHYLTTGGYSIADRMIVLPWIYSILDGLVQSDRGLKFSKINQLKFLDNLGIRYIPLTGEDGTTNTQTGVNNFITNGLVDTTIQTLFEWVRASQLYPTKLAGYAHATFNYFDLCVSTTPVESCIDYSAPLLPYLVDNYPYPLRTYSHRAFQRVNFRQSRIDEAWTNGTHYSRPSHFAIPKITSKKSP